MKKANCKILYKYFTLCMSTVLVSYSTLRARGFSFVLITSTLFPARECERRTTLPWVSEVFYNFIMNGIDLERQ